jgi:hypothetical protein
MDEQEVRSSENIIKILTQLDEWENFFRENDPEYHLASKFCKENNIEKEVIPLLSFTIKH